MRNQEQLSRKDIATKLAIRLKPSRTLHRLRKTVIRDGNRQRTTCMPLDSIRLRSLVILELPSCHGSTPSNLLFKFFASLLLSNPPPQTSQLYAQGRYLARQRPTGALGGEGRSWVGAMVYLIPLPSEMLPPCFQFIGLLSPGVLHPLLIETVR